MNAQRKRFPVVGHVALQLLLTTAVTVGSAIPAQALPALPCNRGCDNGGGDGTSGGSPRPVPQPQPLSWSGSGGEGREYAWNGSSPEANRITVSVHTNPIDGHHAWWMTTTATLDKTTKDVQVSGTIQDDQWFNGFTGGVHVIGADDNGNILCQTGMASADGAIRDPAWGVVGKLEAGASSRQMSARLTCNGATEKVTRLMVVNFHNPRNRINDVLATVERIVKLGIPDPVDLVKKIIEAVKKK